MKKHFKEFTELYDPIHIQISRYCRTISGNTEDGNDLLQETILNVLEGFDKIRNKAVFKSYMFSVASNLHRMKLRRNKFKAYLNDEEINHIVDYSQDQEYLADFKIIYQKILSLPGKMSETIILFHISDLSLEEIQQIQGGSLSGVKLRLKRGREKLLKMLDIPSQVKLATMLLTF